MLNPVNQLIVSFVKIMPQSIIHIFAKKYVAGENLMDAVNAVKNLNSMGIIATMDVLGEAITSKEEALEAKKEAIEVLEAIEEHKLKSNLSLKPTQLGLSIDTEFCYEQVKDILIKARELGNFVRIDMEDSPYTDKTIELYRRLKNEFPNVGIVLQSYLKRTVDDVKKLNTEGCNYRLCKGIYVEPVKIAFKGKQEIRQNYIDSLKLMLENGNYVGIATHDKFLINVAYSFINEKKIPNDRFEFQMLYGVTEHLRDKINKDGFKIRVYVPFGKRWYAYSMRRLQENPKIAWHITKSIFSFRK